MFLRDTLGSGVGKVRRGGWGVCALRPFAYRQGADTVPVVLDR